ncbi:MAG: GNAT family N-acetyltransferase [Candidatus Hermodarchaeota archaeon]
MENDYLVGKRVKLRPIEEEDLSLLHKWLNHPKIRGTVYIGDYPLFLPLTTKKIKQVFEEWTDPQKAMDINHFMVVKHKDDNAIGKVTIYMGWDPYQPGIEILIEPNHQRQGYGKETLSLVLDYLFNFTLAHNVSFSVVSWNKEAISFGEAMVSQLGFQKNGGSRRIGIKDDQWFDEISFDILKREWLSKKEK